MTANRLYAPRPAAGQRNEVKGSSVDADFLAEVLGSCFVATGHAENQPDQTVMYTASEEAGRRERPTVAASSSTVPQDTPSMLREPVLPPRSRQPLSPPLVDYETDEEWCGPQVRAVPVAAGNSSHSQMLPPPPPKSRGRFSGHSTAPPPPPPRRMESRPAIIDDQESDGSEPYPVMRPARSQGQRATRRQQNDAPANNDCMSVTASQLTTERGPEPQRISTVFYCCECKVQKHDSEAFCFHKAEAHANEVADRNIKCLMCDIFCHDLTAFRSHLEGRPHAKREASCVQMRGVQQMEPAPVPQTTRWEVVQRLNESIARQNARSVPPNSVLGDQIRETLPPCRLAPPSEGSYSSGEPRPRRRAGASTRRERSRMHAGASAEQRSSIPASVVPHFRTANAPEPTQQRRLDSGAIRLLQMSLPREGARNNGPPPVPYNAVQEPAPHNGTSEERAAARNTSNTFGVGDGEPSSSTAPPAPRVSSTGQPSYFQLFMCPLTKELMREPVVICDGHTYEKAAILAYIDRHGCSPITGERISKPVQWMPNRIMSQAAEAIGLNMDTE